MAAVHVATAFVVVLGIGVYIGWAARAEHDYKRRERERRPR